MLCETIFGGAGQFINELLKKLGYSGVLKATYYRGNEMWGSKTTISTFKYIIFGLIKYIPICDVTWTPLYCKLKLRDRDKIVFKIVNDTLMTKYHNEIFELAKSIHKVEGSSVYISHGGTMLGDCIFIISNKKYWNKRFDFYDEHGRFPNMNETENLYAKFGKNPEIFLDRFEGVLINNGVKKSIERMLNEVMKNG